MTAEAAEETGGEVMNGVSCPNGSKLSKKDGVEGSWMTDELSDIADPSSHECSSAAAAA